MAHDLKDNLLSGFCFAYGKFQSKPTDLIGSTELFLPPGHPPGEQIKINLVPDPKRTEEWILVNSLVNIPSDLVPAELVLMPKQIVRQLAEEIRNEIRLTAIQPGQSIAEAGKLAVVFAANHNDHNREKRKPVVLYAAIRNSLTAGERNRAIADTAARYGLSSSKFETAVQSFAESDDSRDRGIAAYLAGQYSQAEYLLNIAADKEHDPVETLRYLGATQYEQAKYRAAADSFRKALILHGDDANLLSSLASTLLELADWTEAESLMRRALAIDQKNLGTNSLPVARDLNNLAQLLRTTNRLLKPSSQCAKH